MSVSGINPTTSTNNTQAAPAAEAEVKEVKAKVAEKAPKADVFEKTASKETKEAGFFKKTSDSIVDALKSAWDSIKGLFKNNDEVKKLEKDAEKAGKKFFGKLQEAFKKPAVKIASVILGGTALVAAAVKLLFNKQDADVSDID